MMEHRKVLFQIRDLKKYFPVKKKGIFPSPSHYVKANDGINLDIYEGETLGLVGESGCGKSTFGRVLLRLYPQTSGTIRYYGQSEEGIDISGLPAGEMRTLRKDMQMIFQDPYSSLNPRMTAEQIIGDCLVAHRVYDKNSRELSDFVGQVMEECGLPAHMMKRYPHEFSGGERQRIGIARALCLRPKFVVCDEAVSALDVSIQSQIINLLLDLKERKGLTYLFISHDLSVVKYISDRIGVMYLGELVELAATAELFRAPAHPYTQALLSAIPTTDSREPEEEILLEGDIPSSIDPPEGCKFHTRCRYAHEECRKSVPLWEELTPGHYVACHLRGHLEQKKEMGD